MEALVIQEAAERAKGDPERALFIFDMETEIIQQDQSRDALEQITAIIHDAADDFLADPDNYNRKLEEEQDGVSLLKN